MVKCDLCEGRFKESELLIIKMTELERYDKASEYSKETYPAICESCARKVFNSSVA